MRTSADRLRHTILFELLGLLMVTPLASLVLDKPMDRIGIMALILSLTAMLVNFLYNLAFDHILVHLGRSVCERPVGLRCVHAVCFEMTCCS